MKQEYETHKKNWLALQQINLPKEHPVYLSLNLQAQGYGVWVTAKCYLVQHEAGENKYSC